MRNSIKTEEIVPGIKAFLWEGFCLQKDNIRRQYIKGYDPSKLSREVDMMDWYEFEWVYKNEHCKNIAYLNETAKTDEWKDWQRNCDPRSDLNI